MSAFRALDAARAAGVDVRLDGKNLVLSAAAEPPTDVIDMLRQNKLTIVALLQRHLLPRGPIQPWDPDDWRAYYDERAAIAEFDGGLPPTEAEARAFNCCVAEWLVRNPICSSLHRCLECGESAMTDDPLLAIGVVGAGEAWLHRDCVPDWHSARMNAAVEALKAMNIVGAFGLQPDSRSALSVARFPAITSNPVATQRLLNWQRGPI